MQWSVAKTKISFMQRQIHATGPLTLDQVVLQRRSRQQNASLRSDSVHGFRQRRAVVLEYVTLVADDNVGTGVEQALTVGHLVLLASAGKVCEHAEELVPHDHDAAAVHPLLQQLRAVGVVLAARHFVNLSRINTLWNSHDCEVRKSYGNTIALLQPLLPLVLPVEDGVERADDQARRELRSVIVAQQRMNKSYHLRNYSI